jgi:Kef-type K+ transport system membrane component KefB
LVPAALAVVLAWTFGDSVSPAKSEPATIGEIPSQTRLLIAITVISLCTFAGGWVARWLRQPLVVGQMLIGLALGPSLLGRISPETEAWLFSPATGEIIALFGGIGAIFFIFLVGQDFSVAELRRSGVSLVVLGQGIMAIPFLAGSLVAITLVTAGQAPANAGIAFNLLLGLSMCVTALPMLAHILRERGLDQARVGTLGIASAVVGDATAWCILAVTLSIASTTSPFGAMVASAGVALLAVIMWFGARPLMARFDRRMVHGAVKPTLALFVMLLTALATDLLGAHAIFGAFLTGLIVPRSESFRKISSKLEGLIEWLLLPMFFVSVGLQLRIELVDLPSDLLLSLYIFVAAVGSKTLATVLTARLLGVSRRSSTLLAAMMNCRGLTELIVLNIGLAAGILNEKLFTILTIISILTTMLTGPALDLVGRLQRSHSPDPDPEPVPAPAGSA